MFIFKNQCKLLHQQNILIRMEKNACWLIFVSLRDRRESPLISIGKNVIIKEGSNIYANQIGDYVIIGKNVTIVKWIDNSITL